ncbi:HEAT repeat domain-containing protein [Pyxidicoccus sp. MSG2]|uniref:HEAT repeat domain-containing protein n=1 Tax=Pyxidicoccus sp. MSG2 TaxID=2996790 RepID=UPI00226E665C|nr:HEAT repeat domain-containing protein [Pyxidicoccus sp. MSG2]MCY1018248.1 HEAT repeat domain-containing protein [Pyxidicoccus sp. MSG2]
MSPRLKSLLLCLAILAAAGLWRAGLWATGGRTASPGARPPGDSPPVEVIRQGVKGPRRVLTPGQRHRYSFDLDTRTIENTEAGPRTAHTGWGGELALTYLGAEGGQHLFQGQVVLLRVEEETDETPVLGDEERREFQAMFERPVYVAQDARGRVLAVHFDAVHDVAARRFVRSLLASTQFVAEQGQDWSTEETDTTGDFESEYRAGGSANAYTKTKRRYLRVSAPARVPPPAVPRLRGHLAFTLFEDGHVKEAAGSDVVDFMPIAGGPVKEDAGSGVVRFLRIKEDAGSDAVKFLRIEGDAGSSAVEKITVPGHVRAETRVALTSVGVDHQSLSLRDFQAVRASLRAERLSERALPETPAPSEDRRLVGNAKPDDLLKQLARAMRPEARDAVRARLAALFRLEPAEADRAARRVRQGEAGAALSEQVVQALGSAGTREAQRALASVLEEARVRPETLAHAAKVAARVERPTAELAEALDRVVDGARDEDVRNTAALAVGSVVKGLEPMEPGRSQALLEQMLRRCHARTMGPVVCLRTLANAGAPGGLAYARSALLHPAPMVRGTATEALRAMPGAEVDVLLDQVLLGDPSPRVRALAVAAISQRVAGPHLRAVAMALRAESSEQVRLEVVRMLGGWKAMDEVSAALLRDAADNDASERVRRLAAALLAG